MRDDEDLMGRHLAKAHGIKEVSAGSPSTWRTLTSASTRRYSPSPGGLPLPRFAQGRMQGRPW
jgi:hypothetical protein